jgi:Tol biopolymer transport system component
MSLAAIVPASAQDDSGDLRSRLAKLPYQVVFEAYEDDNWDLFVMHADGSGRRNLTNTPDVHELYPQAAPDGSRLCFLVDTPRGRDTLRSLYVMRADGGGREKIADGARHPAWSPDGTRIAFAKQEFPRFNVKDFVTKYLYIADLASGQIRRHPNDAIEHIYVPSWSDDGRWIFATVHGGMGFGHAIVAIEADGQRVVDLNVPGCRPCVSPDGRRLTWSADDHTVSLADIDTTEAGPRLRNVRTLHHEREMHLYHPDFSPDGRYVSFSLGPGGRCPAAGPGTHTDVAEMVGVRGPWDIYVQAVDDPHPPVRITHAPELSNKESEWIAMPGR